MEEPNPPPVVAQNASPPSQPQPQPPPSTAFQPPPPLPTHSSMKRKLVDNVDSHYSKYFKIRAIVKDLRPHFIEILRTPDFRNSKAAEEIKTQMKLLMDLYQQMVSEATTIEKSKNLSGGQSLPGLSKVEVAPAERHPEGQPQSDHISQKILDPVLGMNDSNKKSEDALVGGSNFGWNFIMLRGSEPIYYGVTKESRKNKVTPEEPPTMN